MSTVLVCQTWRGEVKVTLQFLIENVYKTCLEFVLSILCRVLMLNSPTLPVGGPRRPRPLPGAVSHTHITRCHCRPIRSRSILPKTRLTTSRFGTTAVARPRKTPPPVIIMATQVEHQGEGLGCQRERETEKR